MTLRSLSVTNRDKSFRLEVQFDSERWKLATATDDHIQEFVDQALMMPARQQMIDTLKTMRAAQLRKTLTEDS